MAELASSKDLDGVLASAAEDCGTGVVDAVDVVVVCLGLSVVLVTISAAMVLVDVLLDIFSES